jgi:hypothetical protein
MLEGDKQIESDEQIEALRLILEKQQSRPVAYDEALEVGEALLDFLELLAFGD